MLLSELFRKPYEGPLLHHSSFILSHILNAVSISIIVQIIIKYMLLKCMCLQIYTLRVFIYILLFFFFFLFLIFICRIYFHSNFPLIINLHFSTDMIQFYFYRVYNENKYKESFIYLFYFDLGLMSYCNV